MKKYKLLAVSILFICLLSPLFAIAGSPVEKKVSVNVNWNAYTFGSNVENFEIHIWKEDKPSLRKKVKLKASEHDWDFINYTLKGLDPGTNYCASLLVDWGTHKKFMRENVCFTSPDNNDAGQSKDVCISWLPFGIKE